MYIFRGKQGVNMIGIPAVLVLVMYILISQYLYYTQSTIEAGYTRCFRCRKCEQVHIRESEVCLNCGHVHEYSGRMHKEVGKWKFTRRPTKILFYTVDQEWKPKEEE